MALEWQIVVVALVALSLRLVVMSNDLKIAQTDDKLTSSETRNSKTVRVLDQRSDFQAESKGHV